MGIAENIKKLMRNRGINQVQLAEQLGITQSAVSAWLLNKRTPSAPQRKNLCDFFSISESELVAGNGLLNEPGSTYSTGRIPVIPPTTHTDPTAFENDPAEFTDSFIIAPISLMDTCIFALQLEDDSMAPRYMKGDYVIAGNSEVISNKTVIIRTKNENIICRIFKETDGKTILKPINPKYDPLICSSLDILWVYPVIGMYRNE